MMGRTILHYQIVETLGHGGMGVVYKAKDTVSGNQDIFPIPPETRLKDCALFGVTGSGKSTLLLEHILRNSLWGLIEQPEPLSLLALPR